jgi:cytoskeletal protein CcmA (bactofilin family)
MENNRLQTGDLSVIGPEISIVGDVTVCHELHLYGKISGEVHCKPGSVLVCKAGSLVEGKIFADQVIIDGFVKGQIEANGKIWITSIGKVAGAIKANSLQVDPGAVFEAKVEM